MQPFSGETRLYIYPGYRFRVADGMMTNFHLPRSTLLLLVSAYTGLAELKRIYRTAIAGELPLLQLWRCELATLSLRSNVSLSDGITQSKCTFCFYIEGCPRNTVRQC